MSKNYFKSGTWNCFCQVCGKQIKSDEILRRWDGVYVCKEDYETRHILDFLRPVTEQGSVPFIVPEPADLFIVVPYLQGAQAIAGIAITGLAVSGYTNPNL